MTPPLKRLSLAEAAKAVGISKRRLQILCAEGRVRGAERIGNQWALRPGWSVRPAKSGPSLTF